MDTQRVDGWSFPATSRNVRKYIRHADALAAAMPYCKRRRRAVQAGGHCGTFPVWLAQQFSFVYTWEPEATNFACMVRNLFERNVLDRVFPARGLLGRVPGSLELSVHGKNIGGHKVMEDKPGNYPVATIDSLGFKDIDLIALDVENMEHAVLVGAYITLSECKPVLMIEAKDFGQKGTWGDRPGLMRYLDDIGYKTEIWTGRDVVMTCRK